MVNAETEFELWSEESFNKLPKKPMRLINIHCMRTTQIQGVEWKTIVGKRHESWNCNENAMNMQWKCMILIVSTNV